MSDVIDDLLRKRGITTPPDVEWFKLKGPKRWITKEEAIVALNVWRETCVPKYNLYYPPAFNHHYTISSGVKNVYLNGLIDDLIERIEISFHDPITVVAEYNYEMDNILTMSDNSHHVTHQFAGFMERASYEILLYLKEKEKELNENER